MIKIADTDKYREHNKRGQNSMIRQRYNTVSELSATEKFIKLFINGAGYAVLETDYRQQSVSDEVYKYHNGGYSRYYGDKTPIINHIKKDFAYNDKHLVDVISW